MTELKHVLAWCLVLNYALIIGWSLTFVLAHEWFYRLHSRWFRLTVERFDALNWGSIAVFKILVIVFNVVPLLALWLVGR